MKLLLISMLLTIAATLCPLPPARAGESDTELLARLVFAEACGEPVRGKLGVASVVYNRTITAGYPDTVRAVIFQKNAFESVTRKSRLWKLSGEPDRMNDGERVAWVDAQKAAKDAFYASKRIDNIIAFRVHGSKDGEKYFSKLDLQETIGNQDFYRQK